MNRALPLAGAFLIYAVLATANAGGYRFGVSDQAFYIPAVELSLHPDLFPRDRALLAPQMRLWLGDQLFAGVARLFGGDLPVAFASLYMVTLTALFAAAIAFARALACGWWTTAAFVLVLTLRHRIMETGVNSFEGYFHPRVLAFALGLGAFAAFLQRGSAVAIVLTAAALAVHTTTAIWFALALSVAFLVQQRSRRLWGIAAGAGMLLTVALMSGPLADRLTVMDDAWLSVFADRDYLFPASWPAAAWFTNLGYAFVIVALYRRRAAGRQAPDKERALVGGVLALAVVFLLSVPLTELRLAIVVQAQVNRVFWLLDTMAALYLVWLLIESGAPTARSLRPAIVVGVLVALSAGRAIYVVNFEADRSLVRTRLAPTAWTDVAAWLRQQPATWHVLADPGHAWRFGSNIRVAAERDTVLDASKDPILALYDRAMAARVAERMAALSGFGDLDDSGVRALAAKYDVDVFVSPRDRVLAFPVLYRNAELIVYDLR